MSWHLYLKGRKVYVPTVAQTEAGYYLDIDPVTVLGASDRQRIIDAVKAMLSTGHSIIQTPTRANFPEPVVMKYAGVKSWSNFERDTQCWSITRKDLIFQLHPPCRSPPEAWGNDLVDAEILRGETAVEALASAMAEHVKPA